MIAPRNRALAMRARMYRGAFRLLLVLALGVVSIYGGDAHAQTCSGAQAVRWTAVGVNYGTPPGPAYSGTHAGLCSLLKPTESGFTGATRFSSNRCEAQYNNGNWIPGYIGTSSSCQTRPECPVGQVFNDATWTCQPATQCTTHPQGTRLNSIRGTGTAPDTICLSNCTFNLESVMDFPTLNAWNVNGAVSTGAFCDGTTTGVPEQTPTALETPIGTFTPSPDPTTGQGHKVGCGYLNGEYKCLGEPAADGKCTATATNAGYCVVQVTPTSGKTPDTAPAGKTPVATVTTKEPYTTGTATTVTNIYNTSITNGSSSGGTSSGGTSSGGTSSGGDGECTGDECGGGGEFNSPGKAYQFGSVSAELAEARAGRASAFAQIRAEASAMFGGLAGSSGRLPSWSFSVRGEPVTIDLNVYADKVSFLGAVLVFISLVAAATIIFGGRD